MSHLSVSPLLSCCLLDCWVPCLTLVLPFIIISTIRKLNVPSGNFYGLQSRMYSLFKCCQFNLYTFGAVFNKQTSNNTSAVCYVIVLPSKVSLSFALLWQGARRDHQILKVQWYHKLCLLMVKQYLTGLRYNMLLCFSEKD